jgi:hypothetical protein
VEDLAGFSLSDCSRKWKKDETRNLNSVEKKTGKTYFPFQNKKLNSVPCEKFEETRPFFTNPQIWPLLD